MAPHFFKIIAPHLEQHGSLELPRKFVQEHGHLLTSRATLTLPTGAVSEMEVEMRDGRAWLHNGWQDFVEKYYLELGHFLVFTYHGRSRFDVRIFDLTTSEVHYPTPTLKRKLVQVKVQDSEDVVDEDQPRKLSIGQQSPAADFTVMERAIKSFRSPNPHFGIIVQPSYISGSCVSLPASPGRSYFCERENPRMSVIGVDGRIWSMKYNVGRPPWKRVIITIGWHEFATHNRLQVGDACVFEVVDSGSMEFKVTLLRSADQQLLAAMEETPVSFEIHITPSYVFREGQKSKVHIPQAHSKRYIEEVEDGETVVIFHGANGNSWPIKCQFRNGSATARRAAFGCGWEVFANDNNLRVGDTCIFEMINGKAKEYKVSISRGADHGNIASPRFFKPIVVEENGPLVELPGNFVMEYGEQLHKHATLKLPTGVVSEMEVKNKNGRVWLHNGWQEFAEKYSLKFGHIVLFTYRGRSSFDVIILDSSASEIVYPVASEERPRKRKQKLIQVKQEDCEDGCPNEAQKSRKGERRNQTCSKRKQRIRQHPSSEIECPITSQKAARKRKAIRVIEEDCEDVEDMTNQSRKQRTRQQCSPIGNKSVVAASIAMKRFMSFESPNPHFDIVMQQSHVTGTQMSIPVDQARRYFRGEKNQIMSVKGVDGRTWSMAYTIGTLPRYRVRICHGWKKFATYNHLQVGDICVFEVVDRKAMDLKVTIFKNCERVEAAPPPSFVICISPSYLSQRANVNIPKDHFERYLKEDRKSDTVVLHGARGKSWSVKCQFSTENAPKSRAAFVHGWEDFAADNNLKVGDTCNFEMIMGKANEYKVTISRVADQA